MSFEVVYQQLSIIVLLSFLKTFTPKLVHTQPRGASLNCGKHLGDSFFDRMWILTVVFLLMSSTSLNFLLQGWTFSLRKNMSERAKFSKCDSHVSLKKLLGKLNCMKRWHLRINIKVVWDPRQSTSASHLLDQWSDDQLPLQNYLLFVCLFFCLFVFFFLCNGISTSVDYLLSKLLICFVWFMASIHLV